MNWRWACIVQLDTVQVTARIAHSRFICKRNNEICEMGLHCAIGHGTPNGLHCAFTVVCNTSNEMDRRMTGIGQLDMVH